MSNVSWEGSHVDTSCYKIDSLSIMFCLPGELSKRSMKMSKCLLSQMNGFPSPSSCQLPENWRYHFLLYLSSPPILLTKYQEDQ